jgi:hypothetical protein
MTVMVRMAMIRFSSPGSSQSPCQTLIAVKQQQCRAGARWARFFPAFPARMPMRPDPALAPRAFGGRCAVPDWHWQNAARWVV